MGLPDVDLNVPSQSSQESQQAFDRIVAKVSSNESRDIGLRQPEQLRCLDLLQPAPTNDVIDAGDELRLQQVRLGIG